MDVKKCVTFSKFKKGNILLVLGTLILFQMAFKTQEIRFQTN